LYLKSHLKSTLVAKSSQVGVKSMFMEIRLPHKILLVGYVYRPPSTSVVYHLLGAQGYGLSALDEVCADILPGYGNVYLFVDFNVNLLDSSKHFMDIPRREHVSHLVPNIIGVSLATHLRIHLLTFLHKILHIRHPCYLFTLFHFASFARTRNLIVTPHWSLAMGH
jgi:hypothetical protein